MNNLKLSCAALFFIVYFNIGISFANDPIGEKDQNRIIYNDALSLLYNKNKSNFNEAMIKLNGLSRYGDALSINKLAQLYRFGYPMIDRPQFLRKNVVLSYAYSLISSSLGDESAKAALDQKEWWRRAITDEQISEAKKLANKWRVGENLPIITDQSAKNSIISIIDDETIYFNGPVYRGSFKDFQKLLNDKIKKIKINSSGGSIYDGVKIGLSISAHKLIAEVSGECLSACANYLFIGAYKRIVDENGIVCFHGGNLKISDILEHYKIEQSDSDDVKKIQEKDGDEVDKIQQKYSRYGARAS